MSAADLLGAPAEPIRWLWDRFLPDGALVLLSAFMKVGKSTFAYALALAVARGDSFLGYATDRAPVLILAVEEHRRDVRRRLERFGLGAEDLVYIHTGRLADSPRTLDEVRRFVAEHNVRLVILDTLSRFWGVTDENSNAEIVRRVSPLLDFAHDSGATVLLVHHERKSGGEEGQRIRGGSALFALVDQALTLAPVVGGNRSRRMLSTLGRYEDTPRQVLIELVDDQYRCLGTPEQDVEVAHTEKVWAALSESRWIEEEALSSATALSRKLVKAALSRLGDKVERGGRGVKGEPFQYRRAASDSIPSRSHSKGAETNPALLEAGSRSCADG